jgi:formate dehydrogenase iron-sulfur subunit
MSVRLYVPREATARALGADAVVRALQSEAQQRGVAIELVRTGSRGLFWLEPLIEVETPDGRIGYGPVKAGDVASLFDAGLLQGRAHRLSQGPVEAIPYLKRQERLTCARLGVIDPVSVEDYRAHGGYAGLAAALSMQPADIVQAVSDSGLRGRGGAAFPTGIKWKTVLGAAGAQKYIVCNADEGDSGTFSDRLLMEGDPLCLVEGMSIAALAVGATRGYIYLRWEYPQAHAILGQAIAAAYQQGLLGSNVMGSGRAFDLEVREGAGAYICGEETSLLESLEGRRGQIRFKPPLPAIKGLFGCPTVVNNVITFASVPIILARGAAHYRDFGMGRSRGSLPIQLTGNIARGGLVERAFGVTLRELLYDYGGGTRSGRPIRAVQVGGPLGAYWPESRFDTPLDYEAFAAAGGMLGHGGIVVFDDTVDMAAQARYAMEFCAIES